MTMKAAPLPRPPGTSPAGPPSVNGGSPLRYGGLQGGLYRRILRDILLDLCR